jgi:hypothetical protein
MRVGLNGVLDEAPEGASAIEWLIGEPCGRSVGWRERRVDKRWLLRHYFVRTGFPSGPVVQVWPLNVPSVNVRACPA